MSVHGYLITFSTYGSRLQGDPRGSFRRDSTYCPPSVPLVAHNAALQVYPTVMLDAPMRRVVLAALVEVARHREWDLVAAHVRTQHVHTVVRSLERPERVMSDFKAWSARALRAAGLHARDARAWAGHGSTVYLWNERQLREAAADVFDRQGSRWRGIPSQPVADAPGTGRVADRRRVSSTRR